MSWRSDSSQLVSGGWVSSAYAGHGVPGSAVPSTGSSGASFLYNDVTLPADASKEIRGLMLTFPSAGTMLVNEDGSFTFPATGTVADGSYTATYQLYVDGVSTGTARTISLQVGSVTAAVSGLGGIASAEAFGTAALTRRTASSISGLGGIASAETFGLADVTRRTAPSIAGLGGIPSGEAFGVATLTRLGTYAVSGIGGIASGEAFGVATLTRRGTFAVSGVGGIASAEAFGPATLNPRFPVPPRAGWLAMSAAGRPAVLLSGPLAISASGEILARLVSAGGQTVCIDRTGALQVL